MASPSERNPPSGQTNSCSASQLKYPPYREPSFECAVQTGINIARLIVDLLKKCPQEPPEKLLEEAQNLADFRVPTERRIGFVGNSGDGKSSSVNSVLDQAGLAKSEACGSAVTAFAVEFRFRPAKRQSPFTLDCSLMGPTQMDTYIRDLLGDYRRIAFADREELDQNYESLQSDSRAAQDVFEAAFNPTGFDLGKIECENNKESREEALDYLMTCVQALEFPDGMNDEGTWIQESEDAYACQDHQTHLQEHGLWPFVNRLCIYAEISMLNHGLVLIDLPGFQDTNLARVRAARKAQAECDDICLVVNIARAIDSPLIYQTLESLKDQAAAQTVAAFNVTIICTHSADLTDRRPLEKMVNAAELRKAKAELQRIDSSQEWPTFQAFRKAERAMQLRLDSLLIEARKKKVTADLRRKYESWLGIGDLKVFCVDNPMYWCSDSEECRQLSGIPQLRQHLEDLPAESLFREKNLFVAKKIPALFASFSTWMESSRPDPAFEKYPRLPEADEVAVSVKAVRSWGVDMLSIFEKLLYSPLQQATESIVSDCLEVAKGWERWHLKSVHAWVRNRGTYRTASMGTRCWNTELLTCFSKMTVKKWHAFEVDTDPILSALDAAIMKPWEEYAERCRTLGAPGNFLISLSNRVDILKNKLETTKEAYFNGVNKLRFNATSGQSTSFMVDCMLEAYNDAARCSGRKSGYSIFRLMLTENRKRLQGDET